MELKLVYRILRKISDWTVTGFYSEVFVDGQENVGRDGPLIIASTHHNEIIDIATLAVTIPYRRHLSFWAKSSMFANPIAGAILSSSGAIPVKRNPNNRATQSTDANASTTVPNLQSNLFRESSNALAEGKVIGVFPEGTSYTQPSIIQVMPGAAWVAVEYIRWARNRETLGKELAIVPVGIVYTDKSWYLSRIYVKYGNPIIASAYTEDIFMDGADVDSVSKSVVKKIMGEVEKQMREMSVNAPDWDTLYSANMARDVLWGDAASIPLKDWVSISQTLIEIFSPSLEAQSADNLLEPVKASLTKYYALLYHTQIEHSILNSLLPTTEPSVPLLHLLRKIVQLPMALLNFIFFVPPMLFYVPAYLTGTLASEVLATEGEEEARAQYKAIGGGLGLGLGASLILGVLQKKGWLEWTWALIEQKEGRASSAKRILGIVGVAYSIFYLLVKWHSWLVYTNYRRLKTLSTLYKLCVGLIFFTAANQDELCEYTRPPLPPPLNPFIKKRTRDLKTEELKLPRRIRQPLQTGRLIRPLLDARAEVSLRLSAYLTNIRGSGVEFLKSKGAGIPNPS